MTEYQVIARKYRPQTFTEVLAQDSIVKTLKNAIKHKKLAQAYLFCGSRGTGKTTLARVFAKALNCQNPTADLEPCNRCSSCKDIASGNSLDVLEIDGASNRGIDDIRQINETVGYSAASGGYKIYIIDEVHMLTKEAFNALLKTLEEPPAKVKFFFATTEPHKVLPTILSRCQRFNLNRIPTDRIIDKLKRIASEMHYTVDEEALQIIAERAEGGLRDAESLLDQIFAFHDTKHITTESVAAILGVMPRDVFFKLDQAGKEGNFGVAFEIAHRVFSEGKDLNHFTEMLTEHFRNILVVKISGNETELLSLSAAERQKYTETAKLYRKDQCLSLLDYLVEMQNKIRFAPSSRIALESALLHIMRSHNRIPIEVLVQRLSELESKLGASASALPHQPLLPAKQPSPSISEDPSPSPADLGVKTPPKQKTKPTQISSPKSTPIPPPPIVKENISIPPEKQHRYDTLLQFSAVELEGTIQKNPQNTKT